jgi:hypothetical protein
MKKFILSLLAIGLVSQVYSQITKVEELSEVVVTAVNYKYLNQTDNKEAAVPVQMLQRKVAAYDADGKILRTIEKFKDIKLPSAVTKALLERFPNWDVVSDVYRVTYTDKMGAKKHYKLKLQNGERTMKVKMNEDGEFL